MPMKVKFTQPKADIAAAVVLATPLAEQAMADVLLAAGNDGVPVEFGELLASGRTVPTATGVAVTYGRDDDGDGKHAPSNQYVLVQHEDLELHHPNGGHAKWLEMATHSARGDMLAAAAVSLRKALR